MSHDYYFTCDNTATGEKVGIIGLSNISHHDWQTKAGLSRQMRNTETGEVETWLWHTTIHDKEPLSMDLYELEDYVDRAQEAYGDESPQHMQMLYDFIATANALVDETGVVPTIFF